jgi:large subunit ribosomal protein L3
MEFLAEKIGMSRTVSVPSVAVTLLKVKPLKIVESNEGTALVAYASGKKMDKAIEGQQKKYNLSKEFNRFMTLDIAGEVGDVDFSVLAEAGKVQISNLSKGRGFSGVIKRHGFSGGPGGHGSRFHRAPGSIGNNEFPGRVQKGRKMPGQYGNAKVSVRNEIVSYDAQSGVLVLKGAVPGANGTLAKVKVI